MCHYTSEALKAQVERDGPENRAVSTPDLLPGISHSELATKKLASSSKHLKNKTKKPQHLFIYFCFALFSF